MGWQEWVYLSSRVALSGLTLAVCWMTVRFVRSPVRVAGHGQTGLAGAALLGVAALLSAYDGIDNVLLRPNDPIQPTSWIWFVVFDVALPIYAWLLIRSLRERNRLLMQLEALSITDPLTGALNRRGFLSQATASVAQARRAHQPAVLVMLDLDRFKTVNDTYGHSAGDVLLKTVVRVTSMHLREGDLLGRLGGDEFALLMLSGEVPVAADVVARVLHEVKAAIAPLEGGPGVGVSAGMATVDNQGDVPNAVTRATSVADDALYQAKRNGKGRIVIADNAASLRQIISAPAN